MLRKKLFYFALALNVFFYFGLAVLFYGVQNRVHQEELEGYYRNMAQVIDQEMGDRLEFYQRWFKHLYDLPLKDKAQREQFFNNYDITYVGKFVAGKLEPLAPFSKPPPFPSEVLAKNSRYLFFRDAQNLYFTYTLSDKSRPETTAPHLVVQREDRAYFLRRAEQTGAKIVVLEAEEGQKTEVLFSNLKPEQTQALEKDFDFDFNAPKIYRLSQEPFYVIPLQLHSSPHFKQTLALAFSLSSFFFTATFSMAVFLLACFCASVGMLYFGYLKSRPNN